MKEPFENNSATRDDGAATPLRRFFSRRAFWHSAGFVLALAIAWLVVRAYRHPDFMIDIANMQFC